LATTRTGDSWRALRIASWLAADPLADEAAAPTATAEAVAIAAIFRRSRARWRNVSGMWVFTVSSPCRLE
jgi:hypothetical protein